MDLCHLYQKFNFSIFDENVTAYLHTAGPYLTDSKIILGISLLAMIIVLMVKLFNKDRTSSFFLFWFLVALIPVSNIFPNANSIAHRYMYLPSIGFITVLVLLGQKCMVQWKVIDHYSQLGKIFAISVMGLCIAVTFPLNYQWRSNYTVALELIRSYPGHFKGYSILGFEYYHDRKIKEARGALIKSLQLGNRDPRIYSMFHALTDSNQSL